MLVRDKCVITGSPNLHELHCFNKFPVYAGATDKPMASDIFADMDWAICKDSGMIQLKKLLPLEVVYPEYHSEAIGKVWDEHRVKFSEFIAESIQDGNVLEIGGSNGLLSALCLKNNSKLKWTIVDPVPSIETDSNVTVIKGYFSKNLIKKKYDVIVHSHCLEHSLEPSAMLKDIHASLSNEGYNVFSVPNLYVYFKNKFVNTINFEHTCFLTEHFIDYLLKSIGYTVIRKEYFQEHSIFYFTQSSNPDSAVILENKYEEYLELFNSFLRYYDPLIRRFNGMIKNFHGKIYLFGGHIFSQFLLYRGLDASRIVSILDNSDKKNGQRLYGTGISITKPKVLKEIDGAAVILKAGQYQQEIKAQLRAINKNIIIWE